MGDVEDADALKDCHMLSNDAVWILDRHIVAGEVGHLGSELDMDVMEGGFL